MPITLDTVSCAESISEGHFTQIWYVQGNSINSGRFTWIRSIKSSRCALAAPRQIRRRAACQQRSRMRDIVLANSSVLWLTSMDMPTSCVGTIARTTHTSRSLTKSSRPTTSPGNARQTRSGAALVMPHQCASRPVQGAKSVWRPDPAGARQQVGAGAHFSARVKHEYSPFPTT